MKLLLCNEVVREMDFAAQCEFAAALGYDGLELAPFTLGEAPHLLEERKRNALRKAAADAGVEIVSLHWLLVTPEGLSITTADDTTRARTVEVMKRLIDLCASLGGRVLVHGSPQQRTLSKSDPGGDAARGLESFAAVAEEAEKVGVVYCVEPLSPEETNFINTVEEAAALVRSIGSPALKTMVDCRAAALSEMLTIPELLKGWLPTGLIGHVHLNDTSRGAPGQGETIFAPILAALARHSYDGALGVEPFVYKPDGPTVAARAAGYIRGILETLSPRGDA